MSLTFDQLTKLKENDVIYEHVAYDCIKYVVKSVEVREITIAGRKHRQIEITCDNEKSLLVTEHLMRYGPSLYYQQIYSGLN